MMHSRFYTLANALVYKYKNVDASGNVVLLNQKWTPHNLRRLILTGKGAYLSYYKSEDSMGQSVPFQNTFVGHKDAPELEKLKSITGLETRDDLLAILYKLNAKASAVMSNVRDVIIVIGGEWGIEPVMGEDILEHLGLSALKSAAVNKSFTDLTVTVVPGDNYSLKSYTDLIKSLREKYVAEYKDLLPPQKSIDMTRNSDGDLRWNTEFTSGYSSGERSNFIWNDAVGQKLFNVLSDGRLLKRYASDAQGIRVIPIVTPANYWAQQFEFNIANYPADEPLRKFISDNYWKPAVALHLAETLAKVTKSDSAEIIPSEYLESSSLLTGLLLKLDALAYKGTAYDSIWADNITKLGTKLFNLSCECLSVPASTIRFYLQAVAKHNKYPYEQIPVSHSFLYICFNGEAVKSDDAKSILSEGLPAVVFTICAYLEMCHFIGMPITVGTVLPDVYIQSRKKCIDSKSVKVPPAVIEALPKVMWNMLDTSERGTAVNVSDIKNSNIIKTLEREGIFVRTSDIDVKSAVRTHTNYINVNFSQEGR